MMRILADNSFVLLPQRHRGHRGFSVVSHQFSVTSVSLWLSLLCHFNMFYPRKSASSAFYSKNQIASDLKFSYFQLNDWLTKGKMSPRTAQQLAQIRQKTRERILNCALELFAAKGFHGTSIEAIARKAGISKGLAYHYFSGKEKILEALMRQGIEAMDQLMSDAGQIEDPHQRIVVLIERTFAHTRQDEHFWRLYFSLLLQPEVWEDFHSLFADFFTRVVGDFEMLLQAAGAADPQSEAYLLAALFDGIALHFMIGRKDYPLEMVKNALIRRYSRKNL